MQVWRNGKLQFIKPVLWKLNKKKVTQHIVLNNL